MKHNNITKFKFFKLSTYIPMLFLLVMGLSLIFFRLYPVRISYRIEVIVAIGIVLFIVGSLLIFLSEKTRNTLFDFSENLTCYDFAVGIYKKSRYPGAFGFILLFLGFACFLNSYAVLFTAIIFFFILSFIIIPIIEKKKIEYCGDAYREYMQMVRMWW